MSETNNETKDNIGNVLTNLLSQMKDNITSNREDSDSLHDSQSESSCEEQPSELEMLQDLISCQKQLCELFLRFTAPHDE